MQDTIIVCTTVWDNSMSAANLSVQEDGLTSERATSAAMASNHLLELILSLFLKWVEFLPMLTDVPVLVDDDVVRNLPVYCQHYALSNGGVTVIVFQYTNIHVKISYLAHSHRQEELQPLLVQLGQQISAFHDTEIEIRLLLPFDLPILSHPW